VRLLFLCTGNYYRSRFAEELWTHLENQAPSGWHAESRGLLVDRGLGNVGPISRYARQALAAAGVRLSEPIRAPRQVESDDFVACAPVIAMSDSEHRGMMQSRFPAWEDAVEYWDIDDIEVCPAEVAMKRLESRVHELRVRLLGALAPSRRT
jgi:protein-tyrosine phosphatase